MRNEWFTRTRENENLTSNDLCLRTTHANNGDSAATGWSRERSDRIMGVHRS